LVVMGRTLTTTLTFSAMVLPISTVRFLAIEWRK
jgi:hypothetical protein